MTTTARKPARKKYARKPPRLIPPDPVVIEGLDLEQRNGLRWVSGVARGTSVQGSGPRLFPPSRATLDVLERRGLIEPHPDRPGEHRPTEAGVQLRVIIHRAEKAAAERRRGAA